MTESQRRLRELLDRQSKDRQKAIELSRVDELDDEQRGELDAIETRAADYERQIRAARRGVEDEEQKAKADGADADAGTPDAEERARVELRGRCSVGRFLRAAMRNRMPDGAERELLEELRMDVGSIPMELWQRPREQRRADPEQRAITPAPSTVGVNLDVLRPAVFAPSIADKLSIEMPIVQSGTYATGTITTSATADAVAKSAAVPATAAAFTVQSTTAHRIGAGLDLTLEDIANVGAANFEAVLRQHISHVLSEKIDDQLINGDGMNDDVTGVFQRLSDPTDPTAVADFDAFAAAFANGIDGLWANTIEEVGIVVGRDTYRLSARTFQSATNYKGELSAAAYARQHTAGWWTNKRMPATVSNIQQAILCRKGRSMMPAPTRLAVCPVWFGSISVDDQYTRASHGERLYTLSVLLGDVILVQPDAYEQVAFKVS